MRILVIDDTAANLAAAKEQLQGHELTLVSTYDAAQDALTAKDAQFDAVLTDLMMPPSKQALAPEAYKYLAQELPLGTFLLLLAMKAGVKKVGIVTDTNHHHHPASAAIDAFQWGRTGGHFMAGDVSVVCYNHGKDWAGVLGLLNGEKPE